MNATKAAAAIVLGFALIVGTACGCGSASPTPQPTPTATLTAANEVHIDASYNGNQIALAAGKQLIITLNADGPTGYTWNLSAISDTNIIHKTRNTYEVPAGELPISTWYLSALTTGTATISMKEFMSGNPDPVNTFEVTVTVE